MSELKVHKIGDLCFDFKMGKDVGIDFYLKSEVDAILSEKDAEIAELKNYADEVNKDFELVDNQNERLLKIVRHHKYKRCLAMAEICRHEWCVLYYERKKYRENPFLDHLKERKNRHREKWLELAENFKEAK